MNKLKNSFPAKCFAVFLAVISGTAAVIGAVIIFFTWSIGLYGAPLNEVTSRHAQRLQAWYSTRIFTKMEDISRAESKSPIAENLPKIRAKLDSFLDADNLEYGIIHADTLDDVNLSSKKSYVYQNFKNTSPDENSYSIYFVEGTDSYMEYTPTLLETLLSVYDSSYRYYGTEPKPGSVYWIISNVKNPVDELSNDFFTRQMKLFTFLYNFRHINIFLTAFWVILFLLFTAFCCYSAGKKTSPVTWRHKIPLILNLCFTLGFISLCAGYFIELMQSLYDRVISFDLAGIQFTFLTAAVFLAVIFLMMNLAVRRKAGILWKYTLTRTLLRCVCKIYRICREHTSLVVKSIIVLAVISFLELLANRYLLGDYESLYIFGFIYKLIEVPLIFAVLLQMKRLQDGSRQMAEGDLETKIDTRHMFWEFRKHGEYLNQISVGTSIALEKQLKSEHFKTELITNVSHDIKTPLTSIINYVDLLQKEGIAEEERNEYLSVLERQSARLKKLIEDLIDASKASTGNLVVNMESCNIQILLTQATGEFEEKLRASQLDLVIRQPDAPVTILADNRYLWRIFDNLMNNICKYAQPGTRVYIDLEADDTTAHVIFRNISRYPLNFSGEELLERFVRGDVSRNTEGNGLGLSIARSLAEAMKGSLDIYTDGDLFKVVVSFALICYN